jgi:hypothetical protein
MSKALVLQEVSICIVIKNYNPATLTFGFLQYSNIVPKNWKPAKSPICTPRQSQLAFQNGITIAAQRDRVTFTESFLTKSIDASLLAELVQRYIKTLPHAEYHSVSISPKGFLMFEESSQTPQQYITDTMMLPAFRYASTEAVKTSVQLSYRLGQRQFNLSIHEAILGQDTAEELPTVMFAGSFHYPAFAPNETEHLATLSEVISHWKADLRTYVETVKSKFLQ